MNGRNDAETKARLREELGRRWEELWPGSGAPERPPRFPGAGKAAERLRRQGEYRQAKVVLVLPDPVLLQVRINALMDGKVLIAATPGLKDGLVRVSAGAIPVPERPRALAGNSLTGAGKVLRFPEARLGRVDLVVGPAVAVDRAGRVLGDGRGIWDLTWTLVEALGGRGPRTGLACLVDDLQVVDEVPAEAWDAPAGLVVTPEEAWRTGARPPAAGLGDLPPRLAGLPVVRAVLSLGPTS